MLHKFPHEVDEMPWDDAIALIAHGELERAEMEKSSPNSGGGSSRKQTTVTKYIVPKKSKGEPRGS